MRRSLWWLLVPVACVAAWSCGGTVSTGSSEAADGAALPDGSGGDGGAIPDASEADVAATDAPLTDAPAPDAGPTEFCAGASKAFSGGVTAAPAVVTSSMLVMDCCEGFVYRFHTKAQLGKDLSVMVRAFGPLVSGDYALPQDAGGLEVDIKDADQQSWPGATASGTLHLDVPASYDEPTHATFCLEVKAPGEPLDGTRLFGSDVVVAPWAWQNRFEVRLLADPDMNAQQAAQVPLDSLPLASGDPIIHLLSLAWYESSTNTGYWDSWYSSPWLVNQLPSVGVYGLPFVVLADGERIYLGAFVTAVSSVGLSMPTITVELMPDASFTIEPGYPGGPAPSPDPRSDPRILDVLASSGKLAP